MFGKEKKQTQMSCFHYNPSNECGGMLWKKNASPVEGVSRSMSFIGVQIASTGTPGNAGHAGRQTRDGTTPRTQKNATRRLNIGTIHLGGSLATDSRLSNTKTCYLPKAANARSATRPNRVARENGTLIMHGRIRPKTHTTTALSAVQVTSEVCCAIVAMYRSATMKSYSSVLERRVFSITSGERHA
jgi:hypothetical protein